MAIKQPPYVNGIMELSELDKEAIRTGLVLIRDAFEATDEQPVCDTFYLTSTYNKEHPDAPINGDTCEALLAEEVPQSEV